MTQILIIQGHPDPAGGHLCHALADAYAAGARAGGHEVRRVDVAGLDFPLVRSKAEWDAGLPPPSVAAVQPDLLWADHFVILYPLWLGCMPAVLKGFLEQVLRPGFAMERSSPTAWKSRMKGKSARVVITMGMPALAYRWWFGAHSLRCLKRSILGFVGISPIRDTLVGMVEGLTEAKRAAILGRMRGLGVRGV
ncbi:NAD(P)H-dependent oxidoreductase [Aerophototrophica crusticola]|uniref:NAD(P)H-dependent oxidoreductase n=1 Tax=Aerophototrophica crusticola TaxID=1709002 RepID=A0A858R8K6_9PROT|nr:NAD(P)H-dependent oxidoreductase [Rhodospirillaceae bacterium B3]